MDMIKKQYINCKNSKKTITDNQNIGSNINSIASSQYQNKNDEENDDGTTTKSRTLKLSKNNKYNKSLSKLPTIHELNNMKSEGGSHCGSNRDTKTKTDRDQDSKKYLSHNNSKKDFHGNNKKNRNNRTEYCHSEDQEDKLVLMNDHAVATEGYENSGVNKRKGVLDITDYAARTEG